MDVANKVNVATTLELERYRSEFFGQLRDLFEDQNGVRIEGDRLVFSSEVLFECLTSALMGPNSVIC